MHASNSQEAARRGSNIHQSVSDDLLLATPSVVPEDQTYHVTKDAVVSLDVSQIVTPSTSLHPLL